MKLPNRSFDLNAAMNLTDIGLEQALWSLNHTTGPILDPMVGNTVALTGHSIFHHDESLTNANSANLWTLSKWQELVSASDRAPYASTLNF